MPEKETQMRADMSDNHLYPNPSGVSHWMMGWPPLAALGIPQEMISRRHSFLCLHPKDPVPSNLAVAATIIYSDLTAGDHELEPCAYVKGQPKHPPRSFLDGVRAVLSTPFTIYRGEKANSVCPSNAICGHELQIGSRMG